MSDSIRPNVDSREAFDDAERAYQQYLADGGDVTNEDYDEMCDYFDSLDDEEDEPDFDDYDDSMDGDFDSAMRDAGWGTDEDYGYYGEAYDEY